MSKFRARQLDASKAISIFFQEDISDSAEFNNVTNRTVPQLPTGMEKEEETEHHLQQAIFHHRVIPVPEVYDMAEDQSMAVSYHDLYPSTYKIGRQLVHIHPFSADQDIPEYDMDSEDECWLKGHEQKGDILPLPLGPLQFEEMMDRLEKASGLKAVTLQEAKLLLKDDDDLITAVYDYWLNKRLRLQHPLLLHVKSEKGVGSAPTDPYVAFRKRTEKMQTRKNRKNDETSYEKMLKLRRDLARAVNLVEFVKRREKMKKDMLYLNVELYEKRYELEDFSGSILNEVTNERAAQLAIAQRQAFTPLVPNHQLGSDVSHRPSSPENMWVKMPQATKGNRMRDESGRRERRQYKKKRKHHSQGGSTAASGSSGSFSMLSGAPLAGGVTQAHHAGRGYAHPPDPYKIASVYPHGLSGAPSSDDAATVASASEAEDDAAIDGYFAFKRKPNVNYYKPRDPASFVTPLQDSTVGSSSVVSPGSSPARGPPFSCSFGGGPRAQQYYVAALSRNRVIGLARRRVGRGGRVWMDRTQPLMPSPLREVKSEPNNGDGRSSPTEANHVADTARRKLDFKKLGWWAFRPSAPSAPSSRLRRRRVASPHSSSSSTCSSPPPSEDEREEPSRQEDESDLEVDVETVELRPSASPHTDLLPPMPSKPPPPAEPPPATPAVLWLTARVLEGAHKGVVSDLRVALPLEDSGGTANYSLNSNNNSISSGSGGKNSRPGDQRFFKRQVAAPATNVLRKRRRLRPKRCWRDFNSGSSSRFCVVPRDGTDAGNFSASSASPSSSAGEEEQRVAAIPVASGRSPAPKAFAPLATRLLQNNGGASLATTNSVETPRLSARTGRLEASVFRPTSLASKDLKTLLDGSTLLANATPTSKNGGAALLADAAKKHGGALAAVKTVSNGPKAVALDGLKCAAKVSAANATPPTFIFPET